MRELEVISKGDLTETARRALTLLVIDESSINCNALRELQGVIERTSLGVILAMPDSEYQVGLRGWAKAQIMAAVCKNVVGVMPLGIDEMDREINSVWGRKERCGDLMWTQTSRIRGDAKQAEELIIEESTDKTDKKWIARAKEIITGSNCWLDSAGAVVVRGNEKILESVSTSYNHSNCTAIPVDFRELALRPGERMLFCDSIHAERQGISEAARRGIPLQGTTLYINKFPCRDCIRSIIAAGVKKVVFEKDSYGLPDARLLMENGVELSRVKTD